MQKPLLILFLTLKAFLLYSQPKADFNANPKNGCAPATIDFTNQSTGSGLTYFWDLGNGNTSTYQNPKAIYYTPGLYTIKLVVTDNKGKKDSIKKTNYIEVFKNPVADFEATKTIGCIPFDPVLKDKSIRGSAMITSYTWDYGDGTVKTGASPSYYYNTEKTYDISLIIKDANGCTSDKIRKNYISVYNTPQAMFTADKTYSCTNPAKIIFTNKTTNISGSYICNWEFGDGTKSNDCNPKKTYNDTGSFDVSLEVKTQYGCISTLKFDNFITIKKLKPSFKLTNNINCVNDYASFINTTQSPGIKLISKWEFGDGKSGWGNNASHKYQTDGKYSIKLTIMQKDSSCKETATFTDTVNILKKPSASFYISDTLLCDLNNKDTLIDKSTGNNSRKWFLNGSFLSDKKGVIFSLPKFRNYSVMLVASNQYCTDTLIKDSLIKVIKVYPIFSISPRKGCYPLKVTFADMTISPVKIKTRLWDLGDGSFQTDPSFEYIYTKPGIYLVRLTLTTESGCNFYKVDTVKVGQKPKVSFSYPKTDKCNSDTVYITNAKNSVKAIIDEWKWLIDSKVASNQKVLIAKLKSMPATVDITLIAGSFGCYDTFTLKQILTIKPPYVTAIVIGDSCKGYPRYYINQSIKADEIKWRMSDRSWIKNKDTITVNSIYDKYPLRLWGTNFSSGCTDSFLPISDFVNRYIDFSFSGLKCLPAKIYFSNYSAGYTKYKWIWDDNSYEYSDLQALIHTYTQPGNYRIRLEAKSTNGCKDSISKSINIPGSKVTFEVFPKSGCGTVKVNLITNYKAKGIKKMYWNITGFDPIEVTQDTTIYTFTKPGPLKGNKYIIELWAEDSSGCKNSFYDTVTVSGFSYYFEVTSVATCTYNKNTIQPIFNTNVDKTKLKYIWDIGDGRKFYGSLVDFIYQSEGNFNFSLKVLDENGCISQKDTIIKNNFKTLIADLEADKVEAKCPPLRVNFISKSKDNFGKIVKYLWDFGDGTTSEIKDPSHLYLKAGKFTVKLRVEDNFKCFDEIIFKDLILIDGPVGSYSFDRKNGCTPLNINFDSKVQNTFKLEWDMGDGMIVKDTTKTNYTYTRVGKYIPLLVLADSFGCKYTLPPIDTIEVFPIPVALFTNSTPCVRQKVFFINKSFPLKGYIKKSLWEFGDGDTSTSFEPFHIYKNKGKYNVKLTVWNSDSCFSDIVKIIEIKNTMADFIPEKDFYCDNQFPKLINKSESDTSFEYFKWFIRDTLFSQNFEPVLPKLNAGIYKVSLALKDKFGCFDTIVKNSGLIVGKNETPKPINTYRVTVEDDYSVLLQFKPNNDFDFEKYNVYTYDKNKFSKILTLKNRNDTSITINNLNTLSSVYCFKVTSGNFCQLESDIVQTTEHCSVEAKAKGEVKKVNLKWNTYKGWDVNKYEIYREDVAEKGKYDFLSSVNGNQLYYIDTTVLCKTTHFYKVKAIENGGNSQISWSDTTAAKPIYENSVPPNEVIRATVDFDKEISLEWTGSGTPRIPIKEYIIEKSVDGKHYKWYKSYTPEEFELVDNNVKVDESSYFYRTYAIDTCENRSPFTNFAKSILLKADTNEQERPYLNWSTYQGWTEGVIQYEIQRKNHDGSFTSIGIAKTLDTSFVDEITDLNNYPYYCYRVIGYKNSKNGEKQIISISNEDCAPVRSRIFAANAFTMNHDGLNETFDIKGLYIKQYNMKIFTRWGEKVFESNDMNYDWDGYYKGEVSQMDTYIWIIEATGVDSVKWQLKGTVTIVK